MAIPTPEPGLVVSYTYLWRYEQNAGAEEGRKDRPSVIVLAVEQSDGDTVVTVLPITHRAPDDPRAGVEIPPLVKRHLSLDQTRSWVIVNEGNEFIWPGYDLRKRPNSDRYDYGFLPPRFFDRVRDAFSAWYRSSRTRPVRRT